MLLQYLLGTAGHYAERTKKQLSLQFPGGFKSAAARAARDGRLEKALGLIHCAFRYRGKANYRDALYLLTVNRIQLSQRVSSKICA